MIKIMYSSQCTKQQLLSRVVPESPEVDSIVRDIIENVIANGDKALLDYALRFDKAQLSALEVSKEEIEKAVAVSGKAQQLKDGDSLSIKLEKYTSVVFKLTE